MLVYCAEISATVALRVGAGRSKQALSLTDSARNVYLRVCLVLDRFGRGRQTKKGRRIEQGIDGAVRGELRLEGPIWSLNFEIGVHEFREPFAEQEWPRRFVSTCCCVEVEAAILSENEVIVSRCCT